ncbi:hypothetical protein GCM10027160_27700 [Streptomyces calidiresistens]|uniref:Uncharacterized protein n=1 Tax=Streptomyces calidiresistens TaxID=1485586 RepID=A0A7W3T4Y5_9ACTN|nr:hypothetical protein [Streptomyces calidiresistens]MBB0230881.1 hypothetical protein [Streptomyces calidiresistens]
MLTRFDRDHLHRLAEKVRAYDLRQAVEEVTGGRAAPGVVEALASRCAFDHAGTLLFPDHPGEVAEVLDRCGFEVLAPVPSVVVRKRLARRYGWAEDAVEVSIVTAWTGPPGDGHRGVEVFVLSRPAPDDTVAAIERRERNEDHLALRVTHPGEGGPAAVRALLTEGLSLVPDGGGHNPLDRPGTGGRSVWYFTAPGAGRLEVTCAGHPAEIG